MCPYLDEYIIGALAKPKTIEIGMHACFGFCVQS